AQRRDVSPRLPLALPRVRRRTARERDAAARPGGDCAREPLGISDDGSPDIRLHGNMRRFLFAFVIRLVVGVCAGAVSASPDGPMGSRQGHATAMPAPLGLAATWDVGVAERYGAVVANEVRSKGNDVVFAPTVNIMRTPLGGRTFEGYGEDPFLVSRIAVGWIRGAQGEGVIADVKHFAANNQEGVGPAPPPGVPIGLGLVGDRYTVDAVVDERTLREIYLPAFEAAVKEAQVGSVMCAYNRLNGQYACENQHLLESILKGDWGFAGYV